MSSPFRRRSIGSARRCDGATRACSTACPAICPTCLASWMARGAIPWRRFSLRAYPNNSDGWGDLGEGEALPQARSQFFGVGTWAERNMNRRFMSLWNNLRLQQAAIQSALQQQPSASSSDEPAPPEPARTLGLALG